MIKEVLVFHLKHFCISEEIPFNMKKRDRHQQRISFRDRQSVVASLNNNTPRHRFRSNAADHSDRGLESRRLVRADLRASATTRETRYAESIGPEIVKIVHTPVGR